MLGKQTSHQTYHMMLYHMFPVFFFLLTTVLLLKVGHSGVMPEKSVNCVEVNQNIIVSRFGWFGFMVLNATFNNISVILWRLVALMEETEVPRENHRPDASH